jgi:hypothetical protein
VKLEAACRNSLSDFALGQQVGRDKTGVRLNRINPHDISLFHCQGGAVAGAELEIECSLLKFCNKKFKFFLSHSVLNIFQGFWILKN